MSITINVNDLKENLTYYLKRSQSEIIYIKENETVISMLSNPDSNKANSLSKLVGIIENTPDLDNIRDERLKRH